MDCCGHRSRNKSDWLLTEIYWRIPSRDGGVVRSLVMCCVGYLKNFASRLCGSLFYGTRQVLVSLRNGDSPRLVDSNIMSMSSVWHDGNVTWKCYIIHPVIEALDLLQAFWRHVFATTFFFWLLAHLVGSSLTQSVVPIDPFPVYYSHNKTCSADIHCIF